MKTFTSKVAFIIFALLATTMSYANSIEQDFTGTWNPELPTAVADEFTEHVSPSGTTWGLYSAKLNTFGDAHNLYLTKSKGYVVLPLVDFKVGSIDVTSGEGSISTAAEIALYVGTVNGSNIEWATDPIDKKVTAVANTVYTFILADQSVGKAYKIVSSNNKNAQIKAVKINEATNAPALSFQDNSDLLFGTGLNGTLVKTVNVIGSNLTNDIVVTLEGTNASNFSVDKNNLGTTGGELKITYTGSTAGQINATLKIVSGDLNATLNLAATTVERNGSKTNPFTISDVIALNNTTEGSFWVKGIVAGCADTASETNPEGISKTTTASNIALKENGVTATIPVELPSNTDARKDLNIVDNPDNLNKTILVYGSLELYFGRPGVKGTSEYVLDPITNINNTTAESLSVYAADGVVYVPANVGETIIVTNVAGQVVATVAAAEGVTPVYNLPANQILLVKVGNQVAKVIR